MRDVVVTLIVLGSLPFILRRPFIGVLMWAWIGFMNPHRLTWGFAYDLPFALIVAVVTLVSFFLSGEWRKMPVTIESAVLAAFVFWMFASTLFAVAPKTAWEEWDRVWKIQLMVFVCLAVLQTRERLRSYVWVVALSLGFYGAKGGIFTAVGGGSNLVWGPEGSFIAGNNEIGLALIMTVPLLRFLQISSESRWVKHGTLAVLVLSGLAVLGTHSRGAFLGIIVMAFFLAWKSRQRFSMLLLATLLLPAGLLFMPDEWKDRMRSIQNYEQDSSAMGRLNSWAFAINLAKDRPMFGGGFGAFTREMFAWYAPDAGDFHDAHSIYFEVLGEHGFPGLFLFLTLMFLAWRACSWSLRVARRARDDPEMAEMADLASMVQVSLVGYATSGAFLGLAYFDLYYALVTIAVLVRLRVKELSRSVGKSHVESPAVVTPTSRFRGARAQALGRLYT